MVELDDITCRELVEIVTDYLEDTLAPADRRRFEEHLGICDACVVYVEQMRTMIAAAGELKEANLEPAARDALLDAFRGWKRGR